MDVLGESMSVFFHHVSFASYCSINSRSRKQNTKIPKYRELTPVPSRSPADITARCDAVIADIRERFHPHAIGKPKGSVDEPFDVLIVAHGHFLRAFAGRWIGKNIADNPSLILEAGGVGTLSYEHHKLNEPAILLGGAFMSDVVEEAVEDAEGKKK
jgi:broad specificity phosphatase PhoE